MASTKGSRSDAMKAVYDAVYEATLAGKQLSTKQTQKIYDDVAGTAKKTTVPTNAAYNQINARTGKNPRENNAALDILTGQSSATTSSPFSAMFNQSAENFKTTQQKQADAQKAYDEYVASDAYKNVQQPKLKDAIVSLFRDASGVTSDNVPNLPGARDAKEEELRAVNDYYKRQVQAEEDQKVMETDLQEIAGLTDEDRQNLNKYLRDLNAYNAAAMRGEPVNAAHMNNPIVEKLGSEKVQQLAETMQRSQSAESMQQVQQMATDTANKRPVLGGIGGSLASIPANLAGSVTSPLMYAAELGQRTGRYSTLDPNNIGNLPSAYAETVRSEVAQNIRGEGENTNWMRELAAIGYQGGMSALDSAARMVASGGSAGVSAAIASSGAFGSTLRSASQQGAAPAQAAAMALVDAGLEYVTEKIPTEQVLDMFKKGDNTSAVKNVLKQAFLVEPTSEEVNLFAGVAAETLILGDKSSNNQRLGELIANGMSYQEAKAQIYKELWKEAAQTYAVSVFSGGLSAAGATIAGDVVNRPQQEVTQQAEAAAPSQQQAKSAEDVLAEAVGAELAQKAPAPAPAQPMTEQRQNLENGVALTLGVKSESQDTNAVTNPIESYPADKQNMIRSFLRSVDNGIKNFVERVKGGDKTFERHKISDVSDRAAKDIGAIVGVNANGYTHNINTNGVLHILNRHGAKGEHDQTMSLGDDIARIGWVLENYDNVEPLVENGKQVYSTEFMSKDNSPAPLVKFTKKIDGTYYAVEAACENKYKKLWVQSAYLQKNGDITQAPAESPSANRETHAQSELASPSPNNIVADGETEVKGIGAAEENFSGKAQYQDLLYEGNVQLDRATDARPMELPLTDAQGEKVSAVTGNTYGSKITPDELASLLEEKVAQGDFSYTPISNDEATQMAMDSIARAGNWTNAYSNWKEQVVKGNAGAEMAARGALLLNKAAQDGNKEEWLNTLRYMQKLGTNTAQGLQAMKLIRELTPPDKIAFMEATVNDLSQELGLDNALTIDPALINEFDNAKTDEARDEAIKKIQRNVAKQIPSTWLDKWTALRYTNMLGNMKTQVRNFAGNVGSAAVYRVKDAIATGIEAIVSKLSGGKLERTKSLTTSKELRKACAEYFAQDKMAVSDGGKFGERLSARDSFMQGIQDERRIFKSNAKNDTVRKIGDIALAPMEGYRRATNWAMNNEIFGDEAFGRAAYVRAMAGYLKAHGVTGNDLTNVDSKLLLNARKHAIQEAQEATFHDNSKLAQIMSKAQKSMGVVGEGIMPFTKTPANILTRAVEFSPIGLIDSTVKSIQKASGKTELTGADIVNSWAKTLTGTALVALGAALFDQGLLAGGPDDDEEQAQFDAMNGAQNYAITLPDGTSYTLDWLTPAAMPLFMGAQLWKAFSDQDITWAEASDAFTSIADPMIQMSMLQGLNDTLDGIKYSDNNLGQFFINSCVSYLTQGLTNTLLGQIERSTEDNRQTTFVDKDSEVPQWLQKQLGKASQKMPGWDYQQMDYRNAWGETEENEGGLLYNLLSPGYLSKEESTALSEELNRLRETTGENVFPQKPEKDLTYTDKNGVRHENYNLTAAEYETMQKAEGQTAARVLQEATSSANYAALTDAQKAKVVDLVYDYAREQGRVEAIADYKGYSDSWMQNISGNEAKTIVNKVVAAEMSDSISAITNAWSNKWDAAESVEALNAAYEVYHNMSQTTRNEIKRDTSGRMAAYLEARSSGVKTETFVDLYKTYWELDKSSKKVADKANQWAYTLERAQESGKINERQQTVLKDALGFRTSIPVDATKFDEMTESGLTAKAAQETVKAIANLAPEEGYKNVRDIQNWDAIAAMTISDTEKVAAMKAYMSDTQEAKLDEVLGMGYSPEQYTQIWRIVDSYTSGTGKKKRTIAYMQNQFGISYNTAKTLYEVFK